MDSSGSSIFDDYGDVQRSGQEAGGYYFICQSGCFFDGDSSVMSITTMPSRDIFYVQLRNEMLLWPEEMQHRARADAIKKYNLRYPSGPLFDRSSALMKSWYDSQHDFQDHSYESPGGRLATGEMGWTPSVWQYIESVAINLALHPFDFPFGAEFEATGRLRNPPSGIFRKTRLQHWAGWNVRTLRTRIDEALENWPSLGKIYWVVPESKCFLKDRSSDMVFGDRAYDHPKYKFWYPKSGVTAFLPWAEAGGKLIYNKITLGAIEKELEKLKAEWTPTQSWSRKALKCPDFELVVADYHGRER